MTDRARSATQIKSSFRSQSCQDNRDRVNRTTKKTKYSSIYLKNFHFWLGVSSELHRQTVDHAQRRFEQQLADSERELRWAVRQRRDQSSSPDEKRQATHHLQQLRATLNNDYSHLIQVGKLFFLLHLTFDLFTSNFSQTKITKNLINFLQAYVHDHKVSL